MVPNCHSARSRRRSRRIHVRVINPRPPGEGGPSQTVGEGRGRAISHTPHPPWRAPSPQGESFLSLSVTVDSATPGKPCMQNDMRVWWVWKKTSSLKYETTNGTKWTAFVHYQRHAMSESWESHDEILLITLKLLDVTIAVITRNTSPKGVQRKMIQKLRKNKLVCFHLNLLGKSKGKRE